MPTANDYPLLMATINEPAQGRWTAYVEVDSSAAITGSVVLDVEGVTFTGSVHTGGLEGGRWCGQLVGGTGGLSTTVDARAYRACPLAAPLRELMTDTGETLSSASDSLLDAFAPQWHRLRGPAIHCLARIALSAGLTWRVLRDGTVWIGENSLAEVTEPGIEIHGLRHLGMVELAPLAPNALPGGALGGETIGAVITRLDTGSLRQEVYLVSA